MKSFQCVLFDFDGLLINSEEKMVDCWKKTTIHYNLHVPQDYFDHIAGVDRLVTFERLVKDYNLKVNSLEFFAKRQEYLDAMVESGEISLMPGIEDMLEYLYNEEIPMFIVTSSSVSWPKKVINILKIGHYFSGILGKENVKKVKPDPELYLMALDTFHLKKETTLVFEDSIPGVQAAKQAGLLVHCINNDITFDDEGLKDVKRYRSMKDFMIEVNLI